MATRAQKVRLSIFIIISGALLAGFFLFLVGNRILNRMDTYYIVYENISVHGLELGAAVKFHGVQVGRVVNLRVRDTASVEVEIEVQKGTPIKRDTEAIMTLVGITGLKFVELIGGTEDSELLPPDGTIVAGSSILDTISGQAEIMIAKLEQVLINLNDMTGPETTDALQHALTQVGNVSAQVNLILEENQVQFTHAVSSMDTLITQFSRTAEKIDVTVAELNRIVVSSELETTLANIGSITGSLRAQMDTLQAKGTMSDFAELVNNTNQMVVHYDLLSVQVRDDILRSMSNLEEALDNLRVVTDIIRENPSVLIRGRQTTEDRFE